MVTNSETAKKRKRFWTPNSVFDLVGILGFILALAIAVSPLIYPARAKVTIFLIDFEFENISENSLYCSVLVRLVNDSPKSARIYEWNVSFGLDVPFEVLNESFYHFYHPPIILQPSSQSDLNLSRTLVTSHSTVSPFDVKYMLVRTFYQDDVGYQEATRELFIYRT